MKMPKTVLEELNGGIKHVESASVLGYFYAYASKGELMAGVVNQCRFCGEQLWDEETALLKCPYCDKEDWDAFRKKLREERALKDLQLSVTAPCMLPPSQPKSENKSFLIGGETLGWWVDRLSEVDEQDLIMVKSLLSRFTKRKP